MQQHLMISNVTRTVGVFSVDQRNRVASHIQNGLTHGAIVLQFSKVANKKLHSTWAEKLRVELSCLQVLFWSLRMARLTLLIWITYICDYWGFTVAGTHRIPPPISSTSILHLFNSFFFFSVSSLLAPLRLLQSPAPIVVQSYALPSRLCSNSTLLFGPSPTLFKYLYQAWMRPPASVRPHIVSFCLVSSRLEPSRTCLQVALETAAARAANRPVHSLPTDSSG